MTQLNDIPEDVIPSQSSGSENRFQGLFEYAPTSMQLLAADGTTLQVNRAFENLWLMNDQNGAKEYILSSRYNIFEDLQLQAKGITPYLKQAFAGESVRIPAAYYDPAELGTSGRARWVTATAHPIKDANGQVREVMLMHEDVTEQYESSRRLRESEERLHTFVTATSQILWTTGPDGVVHEDSPSWRAFTGQSVEEWMEDGWQAIHPEDRAPALAAWTAAVANNKPFKFEYRLRHVSRQYRWTLVRSVPVFNDDGSVREWIGTNTDITETKQISDALRDSEAKFRAIANAMPQMVWSNLADGEHDFYNQRWYEFTGLRDDRVDTDEWKSIVHPEDLERVSKHWAHCLATGEQYDIEYRLWQSSSSQYRWVLVRALPVRNESGAITRWMGTCTDVHEQKIATDELRRVSQRKDEFLAMLAHELRNPLAPISSAAELLSLSGSADPLIKRSGEVITRQVKHMTELVDDLLDVSRVTRGLVTLDKQEVDLKAVMQGAVEQARPIVEARKHVLNIRLASSFTMVLGDRTRLTQVVVNLLNNAAKYTAQGGEITLSLETRDKHAVIAVQDNGVGIDASLLPHVFELFTQAERTPDRSQGGLGLGLALVKSIMGLHGGTVTARSEGRGRGSIFTLSLPLLERPSILPEGACEGSGRKLLTRPRHIMIVDDNVDAGQSLGALLRAQGHRVDVCEDAASALELARVNPPLVFILDIGLPDINGYELARQLKAQPETSRSVFIALTGYGQTHDKVLAKASGFHHYCVKPVDLNLLGKLLEMS